MSKIKAVSKPASKPLKVTSAVTGAVRDMYETAKADSKFFRSPILDMNIVDWEDAVPDESGPLWILDNLDYVPVFVNPYIWTWMTRKIFDKEIAYPPEQTPAEKYDLESGPGHTAALRFITKGKESVRIQKVKEGKKNSFDISLRVMEVNPLAHMYSSDAQAAVFQKDLRELSYEQGEKSREWYAEQMATGIMKVARFLGKDVSIPSTPVDIRIPAKDVFVDSIAFDKKMVIESMQKVFGPKFEADSEFNDHFRNGVREIRLVGTPTRGAQNLNFFYHVSTQEATELGMTTEDRHITSYEEAAAFEKKWKLKGPVAQWLRGCIEGRNFFVYLVMRIPAQNACGMLHQPDENKIDAFDVYEWTQQWLHYAENGENSWDMSRLEDVAEVNQQMDKAGVKPRPRTDKDGFTVHPDGLLMWIPPGYNVIQDYKKKAIEKNTDAETKEYTGRNDRWENLERHETVLGIDEIQKRQNFSAYNKLLYVDWYNNKLAYTNTSGIQSTLDIERCMPRTANHVYRLLNQQIGQYNSDQEEASLTMTWVAGMVKDWFRAEGAGKPEAFLKKVTNWGDGLNYMKRNADNFESFVMNGNFQEAVAEVKNTIERIREHKAARDSVSGKPMIEAFPWIDQYRETAFKMYLIDPNSDIPAMRVLGLMLEAAMKWAESTLDTFLSNGSVINNLAKLGLVKSITESFGKFQAIRKADEEQRKAYLDSPKLDQTKPPEGFPLVADDIQLMPHQVKGTALLDPSPQYSILRVQAGGGKTIQVILDILKNLQKGTVKKAMVMCPDHLVKDYIGEANYVTNGRLNVICVTGESLRNWGEARLLELVQKAPINSIIVTSYDFMKNRLKRVMYGREELTISLNCELVRLMGIDGAWLDESHMMRNVNIRSVSVQRLLAEIPFKRLCTGTLIVDQLTDIANQFGLLDPTVFGTKEAFVNRYAQQMMGGKVARWKPGAENEVNRILGQYCTMVTALRKEWASMLPPRIDEYHFVPMTEAQRAVYDAILEETLEEVKAVNPELYKQLMLGDEENADALEALLAPFLARLEQYLTSPTRDKAGAIALRGADAVSPKAKKIEAIIRDHFRKKIPGKILIFTSYVASGATIYNALPPDLKEMCIHYLAGDKFKCAEQFNNDDSKMIMVGVEQSMNTGLNLQIASRLIRVESVWSPGMLEQGESRINRPQLKGKDKDGNKVKDPRTNVFFDWVMVNQTIDVTKIGRLIGKMISSVKFENPNDSKYDAIPDAPLISMNMKSIKNHSDAEGTLKEHMDAFKILRAVQENDFEEYRQYAKKFNLKFQKVPPNQPMKGAVLLHEVPYVSGMSLFASDDLGIKSFANFCRENPDAEDDPTGLAIHTEWGDGEVTGMSKNKLRVKLNSGKTVSVGKLAAFVITRPSVSTKTIRDQMAKLNGLKMANPIELEDDSNRMSPVDDEVPPPKEGKSGTSGKNKDKGLLKPKEMPNPADKDEPDFKAEKNKKPIKPVHQPVPKSRYDGEVELHISILNGIWCLSSSSDGKDAVAEHKGLKEYGFELFDRRYMYAQIKNAKQMEAVTEALLSKFDIPNLFSRQLAKASELYTQGKSKLLNPELVSKAEFNLFYREKHKPRKANELHPYVMIQMDADELALYIIIDVDGTPASSKVKQRIRVPGVTWDTEQNWLAHYTTDKKAIPDLVKTMMADGIKVGNLKEIQKEYQTLKGIRK